MALLSDKIQIAFQELKQAVMQLAYENREGSEEALFAILSKSLPGKDYEIQSLVATAFGQGGVASNVVNASSNNVLLAIVDWGEGGIAPDVITGTGANGQTRNHCRYPQKSVFNGSVFICET
ncbi:hypothetical protein C0989_003932 [Termitomyces sp. Mn162]|nr:hypothetical protein C0989_003932 [Termitomyces sp. Mn162]